MLSRKDIESYRQDGYLPGLRLLSTAEAKRFREHCLRTCAKPLELGDQNPYSLKRHASNRVKPYLLFPWAAELVLATSIRIALSEALRRTLPLRETAIASARCRGSPFARPEENSRPWTESRCHRCRSRRRSARFWEEPGFRRTT